MLEVRKRKSSKSTSRSNTILIRILKHPNYNWLLTVEHPSRKVNVNYEKILIINKKKLKLPKTKQNSSNHRPAIQITARIHPLLPLTVVSGSSVIGRPSTQRKAEPAATSVEARTPSVFEDPRFEFPLESASSVAFFLLFCSFIEKLFSLLRKQLSAFADANVSARLLYWVIWFIFYVICFNLYI